MKLTLLVYTSALGAVLPFSACSRPDSRPSRPNLVFITDAVSSYPVSSPARAMLMTGMYPAANGVTGNCNSQNTPYGVELSKEAVCWSDVLKEEGYRTAYIGKWHLDAPYRPYVDTYNNKGEVAWNEWCPPDRRPGFARTTIT